MSLLKKLALTVLDTALVSVAVVKDVATLGGSITRHHSDNTYTGDAVRRIGDDIEEVREELEQ